MNSKVSALVPCPTCGKTAKGSPGNPWRPFCCERCKLMDLGDWFQERHVISEPASPEHPGTEQAEQSDEHY